MQAHIRIAEKWDGRMPGIGTAAGTWRERARRAEAERDAARARGAGPGAADRRRAPASSSARSSEARDSISWRITAPLRRLGGCGRRTGRPPRDRLRDVRGGGRGVPPLHRAGHLARGGARLGDPRLASVTSLPRSLNIILDAAARHDDLEALVLLHPHTEITDPGSARGCARCWPTRTSASRARRARAGATAIAWWEGAVTAAPGRCTLRRLRRRRVPRVRLGRTVGAARRGRRRRRLAAGPLALGRPHGPLRRGAARGLRLRHGLLPAGARGRPQGRDRRPARRSSTTRWSWSRTSTSGSRATSRSRRSGTGRARRGGVEGARPPGRGRAGGRARDRPWPPARATTRGSTRWSAGCARRPRPPPGGSPSRCGAPTRRRRTAAPQRLRGASRPARAGSRPSRSPTARAPRRA